VGREQPDFLLCRCLQGNTKKKANLKEKELKLKSEELQLQNKKFEQEAAERKEKS